MTKLNNAPLSKQTTTEDNFIPLTNDYMFRAVFQKNQTALKGLISSVLHLAPEKIKKLTITNPIELGQNYDEKAFVLDIAVLLNDDTFINLEMQMANQYNWQDRSLSYLCRSFDQLYQGEDYNSAKPVIHIGFLNFSPFPDHPEFNATYKFMNIKNHRTYSDKLALNVIDLKHIELATEEDKAWEIDCWARLFTATSLEELKMIAKNKIYLEASTQTLEELTGDTTVQMQCRARRDYYKTLNTYNKMIHDLETENLSLKDEITLLKKQLEELKSQQP